MAVHESVSPEVAGLNPGSETRLRSPLAFLPVAFPMEMRHTPVGNQNVRSVGQIP